jgi:hypothetical protein
MIYIAQIYDIKWMVNLRYQKRLSYSKVQPDFWKMAENSNDIHYKYSEEELKNKKVLLLGKLFPFQKFMTQV